MAEVINYGTGDGNTNIASPGVDLRSILVKTSETSSGEIFNEEEIKREIERIENAKMWSNKAGIWNGAETHTEFEHLKVKGFSANNDSLTNPSGEKSISFHVCESFDDEGNLNNVEIHIVKGKDGSQSYDDLAEIWKGFRKNLNLSSKSISFQLEIPQNVGWLQRQSSWQTVHKNINETFARKSLINPGEEVYLETSNNCNDDHENCPHRSDCGWVNEDTSFLSTFENEEENLESSPFPTTGDEESSPFPIIIDEESSNNGYYDFEKSDIGPVYLDLSESSEDLVVDFRLV